MCRFRCAPRPRRGELIQYIPEPWRTRYFLSRNVGEQIYYDAPDYAHTFAMRVDAFHRTVNSPAATPISPFSS